MSNKIKLKKIGVAWGERLQSLEECVNDILIFIYLLEKCDDNFSNWFPTGFKKMNKPEDRLHNNFEEIKNLLCKSCALSEYPQFYYSTKFWNGSNNLGDALSLSFSLGGDAKLGHNNVILQLPYSGALSEKYDNEKTRTNLLALFIEFWDPDKIMVENKWQRLQGL
ncbi:hypothetical protein MKO06_05750 [Gramella sp. GC03-9]|uniref:Uncharacterized protein n=1 Tax=Christiangramia oceanisediminis TaxID=2920386 RepID=A0A9X2I2E7_9FLAO|nr:Imm52 family immunity protein [Gramella oceanisediminis]MCP9199400.1 hypothetical protein [Gramella oceanisediminis]